VSVGVRVGVCVGVDVGATQMPSTHRLGATHCALLVHAAHVPPEHTLLQH